MMSILYILSIIIQKINDLNYLKQNKTMFNKVKKAEIHLSKA